MTATERLPRIGVVIVTFESPPRLLAEALSSVKASIGVPDPEIIVVDNSSSTPPSVPRDVRLLRRDQNDGFSAGVNTGIAALSPECELVFLLNPDARLAPDALALCARRLVGGPHHTVAVAPKMLLAAQSSAYPEPTIDCVGIGVNERAEGANRGLGQPDLGQYDASEEVFGACFGAAMIRRSAFEPDQVGMLDEQMFLYYEDVAWCWTAQLRGFSIVTEPQAVVHHVMSAGVVREHPYDFKFRYTERNLLLCALMFFEPRRALRVTGKRIGGLLKGSLLGRHYPIAGLRAVAETLRALPHVTRVRRRISAKRFRSDTQIIAYRGEERIYWDSVRYEVKDPTAARAAAVARLNLVKNATRA